MRSGAILIFLTLLNTLNYADRYLLQSFAVDVIRDLQLSNTQFTLLTGLLFTVLYTSISLLMGALADRLHRPRLMAVGLVLWSALTAATGLAKNFLHAALARIFVGVGEATITPAALGMLGDLFKPARHGLVSGIFFMGVPLGIGGVFIIAGTLGASLGWRAVFIILGMTGVFLSLGLLLLREPRAQPSANAATAAPPSPLFASLPLLWQALRQNAALRWTLCGGVLVVFAQGALVLDQVWLVQERAFETAAAQQLAGLLFLLGGLLGAALGGLGGDWLQRRRAGGHLYFLFLIYLITAPVSIGFRFVDPSSSLFLLLMFLGSLTITIVFGPLTAVIIELVEPHIRSTTIAFAVLTQALLGSALGNLCVGMLADQFASSGFEQPITWAVVWSLTPGLLAAPCFWLAARQVAAAARKSLSTAA